MRRRWRFVPAGLIGVALVVGATGVSAGTVQPGTSPSPSVPPEGVHVAVGDFVFDPNDLAIGRGDTVVFDFVGPSHHTATDASGLDLYDSGSVGEGEPSTWFTFPAAGGYRFTCTPHPWMGGRVDVPMRVSPANGGVHRTFTATWASSAAADGFVYDVQIRKPGKDWSDWRTGVTARRTGFQPKAGKGTYRFRARMRSLDGGQAFWSAEAVVKVG